MVPFVVGEASSVSVTDETYMLPVPSDQPEYSIGVEISKYMVITGPLKSHIITPFRSVEQVTAMEVTGLGSNWGLESCRNGHRPLCCTWV